MSTIQHVVRNMDALLPSRIWSSEDGLREFVNSVSDFTIKRVLLTYDSEEEEDMVGMANDAKVKLESVGMNVRIAPVDSALARACFTVAGAQSENGFIAFPLGGEKVTEREQVRAVWRRWREVWNENEPTDGDSVISDLLSAFDDHACTDPGVL